MERGHEVIAFKKISQMVRRFLPRRMDDEFVAMGIWIEAWIKERDITWVFIRSRCLDAMKADKRKHEEYVESAFLDSFPAITKHAESLENVELLNQLMMCPTLGDGDRMLLFLKFYRGLSGKEIGLNIGKSKTVVNRTLGRIVEDLKVWAMVLKEEGEW